MEKLDRLNKMYEYACAKKLCKNKKTFAALLNMNEGNLSSAFSGKDTRYLTNNLLLRANAALGDVFNPSWLLYGEGNMLVEPSVPGTEINIDNTNMGHHNNIGHHNSVNISGVPAGGDAETWKKIAESHEQQIADLKQQIADLKADKEKLYQLLMKK